MTQNIQNGSFDIKTGSRKLRIINAAKRASPPSISSYKRGAHGGAVPPPRFSPNLYAKNVVDVFYFEFLNLILVFRQMPK